MPLAWAHAEFIKLMISRDLGYPVDRPKAVWERYGGRRPENAPAVWLPHAPIDRMDADGRLILGARRDPPRRVLGAAGCVRGIGRW